MSDNFDAVEAAFVKAKAAYQADPTPKNKEAHRAAGQALTAAREARRGSTVVTPEPVAAATSVQD